MSLECWSDTFPETEITGKKTSNVIYYQRNSENFGIRNYQGWLSKAAILTLFLMGSGI